MFLFNTGVVVCNAATPVCPLSLPGWPNYVFAFHDSEEIGQRILARVGKLTGLRPERPLMEIRLARSEEIDELQALFAATIAWQQQRGVPTFSSFPASFFAQEINKGAVFVAWRAGQFVGTVSLYESDDFIWDNDPAPALYIHRLASLRMAEGRGAGAALIAWSRQRAARMGKQWLRVDCWADNDELCRFYEGQGFSPVRVKNTGQHAALPEHYQSINLQLFQMPVNGQSIAPQTT